MDTYKIVRYYHPSKKKMPRTTQTGLTLQQAQDHCSSPKSKKDGHYFDGYTKE